MRAASRGHVPPSAAGTSLKDVDATRAVGPCGRWVRAAGRGHVPPGRGAACRWSGAEMGRPAEPAREGQDVHRDLPWGGGHQCRGSNKCGWGRGVSKGTQLTGLKNDRAMRKEQQICSSVEIKSHFCLQGSQGDYELFMSLQTRPGWLVEMARS